MEAHKRRAEEPEFFVFTTAISLAAGRQAPDGLWTAFRAGWGGGYDPAGHKPGVCPDDWLDARVFANPPQGTRMAVDRLQVFGIKPAEGTMYFAQGARFAASREAIRRRPKAYYLRLKTDVDKEPWIGYLMEWAWYYMIGGDPAPCGLAHARKVRQHFERQEAKGKQLESRRARARAGVGAMYGAT